MSPRRARVFLRAVILVVVACRRDSGAPTEFPLTARVLDALTDSRPYTLRLSAAQRLVECPSPDSTSRLPRASCMKPTPETTRRLASIAPDVATALRERPDLDALWSSALLDMASGSPDARQLDRAISRLSEVHARDSTLAAPLVHRAIAHLARASARNDARELFAALDDIETATERDSTAPWIRFDRAVLLSYMHVNRLASATWQRSVETEPNPAWHAEAARRRKALPEILRRGAFIVSDRAIRNDAEGAREFVLDSLLRRWSGAVLAGDSATALRSAAQIQEIAPVLAALHGDSSVTHVARELGLSDARRNAADIAAMNEGIRRYRATDYDIAQSALRNASRGLRDRGAGTLAEWADLYVAGTFLAQRRFDDALRLFESVRTDADARHDVAFAARSRLGIGVTVGRGGALDAAERAFVEAQTLFAAIGEIRSAATAANAIADAQGLSGRSLDAANNLFDGYKSFAQSSGAVRYEDLLVLSQQLSGQGRPHAAATLLAEAELSAADGLRTKDLPETLGRLALVQLSMGRTSVAAGTISRARRFATSVTDTAMRSRLDAELDRAESRIVARDDPKRALALIGASRGHFATIIADDVELQLTGAEMALRIGDSTGAEAMLDSATREVRSLAPTVVGQQARDLAALLGDAQRQRIALALARADTTRAYELTLALPALGPAAAKDSQPRPLRVAPGHVELRFVVLAEEVLTWIGTGTSRRVMRTAVRRDALVRSVVRFRELLRSGDDTAAIRGAGRRLHRTLVGNALASFPASTRLDVATDGVLGDLPIALLTDDDGRYLLERFAISFVTQRSAIKGHANPATSVPLLIGDPAWRRTDFPGMESLRHADAEVTQLASMYAGAVQVRGGMATRDALMRAIPSHRIVHFAGHSQVVVENPEASHLVLAAGASFRDGVLYASDIARMQLGGVRLVVLSSCGRTRDDPSSMGAPNGLESAFLDAGVSSVVSGLWDVDDDAAAELMTTMHAELVTGAPVAVALQRAGLKLMRGGARGGARFAAAGAFRVATSAGGSTRQ